MKYLGGKQRLGKHIAKVILEYKEKYDVDNYIEPFCGALGVLVNISPHFKNVYASDYHCDLIAMWEGLKTGEFIPPKVITETKYNSIKKMDSPNALKAFVGFGLSFGGRFFGAYAPKYTNGKKEDYLKEAKNSLNRKRPLILNVDFKCLDYKKLKPKNSIIYCDPPYAYNKYPIKYRRDTKYYDVFDNDEFWKIMRKWSKNNLVIISETRAPNDFIKIWEKEKINTSSKAGKTTLKNIDEIVITEKLFIHQKYSEL